MISVICIESVLIIFRHQDNRGIKHSNAQGYGKLWQCHNWFTLGPEDEFKEYFWSTHWHDFSVLTKSEPFWASDIGRQSQMKQSRRSNQTTRLNLIDFVKELMMIFNFEGLVKIVKLQLQEPYLVVVHLEFVIL